MASLATRCVATLSLPRQAIFINPLSPQVLWRKSAPFVPDTFSFCGFGKCHSSCVLFSSPLFLSVTRGLSPRACGFRKFHSSCAPSSLPFLLRSGGEKGRWLGRKLAHPYLQESFHCLQASQPQRQLANSSEAPQVLFVGFEGPNTGERSPVQ